MSTARAAAVTAPQTAVLVVDPDAWNRALVQKYLTPLYRLYEARNAQEAGEVLEREPIDLVVIGSGKGHATGIETCRRIRATAENGLRPVLLILWTDPPEGGSAGTEAGADDVLAPPFRRDDLLQRVRLLYTLRMRGLIMRRQAEELQRRQDVREDFLSLLVHDVRNPLATIHGRLQLLRLGLRDSFQPGADRQLTAALEATKSLSDLVNLFLVVNLLKEGGLPIRRQPTPLRPLVAEVLSGLEGTARERRLRLVLDNQGDPVAALDRKLVRCCLEHLATNAVRHSPEGREVAVVVRAEAEGAAIEVADQGPTYSDAAKQVLFDQHGSAAAEAEGGRAGGGLGFQLVKLTVAAHGGYVSVSDRVGGGAVFRVFVPKVVASVPRAAHAVGGVA